MPAWHGSLPVRDGNAGSVLTRTAVPEYHMPGRIREDHFMRLHAAPLDPHDLETLAPQASGIDCSDDSLNTSLVYTS